jgi:hypothetical protein
MSTELIPFSSVPAALSCPVLPAVIIAQPIARRREGGAALSGVLRGQHPQPNTRAAYGVAVERFFAWCGR